MGATKGNAKSGDRALAPEKRRIVRRIRRLREQGRPLNVSAVKRAAPLLIDAVYAVRPFWGWRRALDDAGVAYEDVRVELLDSVECRLCGKRLTYLGSHLKRIHGCTVDEYRESYPGADATAETVRARLVTEGSAGGNGRRRLALPHWEPLWTPEYALDRAWEFHRRGFDMNHDSLNRIDQVVKHGAAFFGSWDEVLRRIGLSVAEVRREQVSRDLSAEEVLRLVKRRRRDGLSMKASSLNTGEQVDSVLLRCARTRFGSWRNALRAAGLDGTSGYGRTLRFPDGESVLEEIRRRHGHGLPLSFRDIQEPGVGDKRLLVVATELFGSWGKAVEAADIDYGSVRIRKANPYRSRAAVVRALRARAEMELSLSSRKIQTGKHSDISLYTAALKQFGRWSCAKKAAGLDAYGR